MATPDPTVVPPAPPLVSNAGATDPTPVAAGEQVVDDVQAELKHPGFAQLGTIQHDVGGFLSNPKVVALEKEIPYLVQESRRGIFTSEFWVGVAAVIGDLGWNFNTKTQIIINGVAGVYIAGRSIAKHGVGNSTPILKKP